MHHSADNTIELCHCGEHDNAGGEKHSKVPLFGKKTELVVFGGSVDISVWQRVDKFALTFYGKVLKY